MHHEEDGEEESHGHSIEGHQEMIELLLLLMLNY
jgi:hypothetical protein